MHNGYTYRQGTIADLEQLKELALLSYSQYAPVLKPAHWQQMAGNLNSENLHSQLLNMAHCIVCEHNKKLVGMAYVIPQGNPTGFFETGWSYIRLLGVDPAYGGQGIGRQLTELCIQFAKASGEKTLALHTSEFQDAARHIYEGCGFIKIKELEPVFDKKYWLYLLAL